MAATQELLLGEGAGGPVTYIEDVFSTYLYTGTGASNSISNGVDLSTKGGLVWIKNRSTPTNTGDHRLYDTTRGANNALFSNTTDSSTALTSSLTSFDTTGFTLGTNAKVNESAVTWASWTFRKQPKFFDVVTYTGTGVVGLTISHNLGSVPGCIIVKKTNALANWAVYHRSLGNTGYIVLNTTAASGTAAWWNNTDPTSTTFQVNDAGVVNTAGDTYVAYLFAHNAGGFGLTGTDNVISCGTYTGTGVDPGPDVNLGFEPQWLMAKNASAVSNWVMGDVMRGFYGYSGNDGQQLYPNLANAEGAAFQFNVTPTGFRVRGAGTTTNTLGQTYIYIAIRRGPMKVPTSGTSLYSGQYAYSSANTYRNDFTVDAAIQSSLSTAVNHQMYSRLSANAYLSTNLTSAETANASARFDTQTGFNTGVTTPPTYFAHLFRRAPSFFDEVCWVGDDAAPRNIAHNLTVTPEMMIVKNRTAAGTYWVVYHKDLPSALYYLSLNTTDAKTTGTNVWRSTAPTSTVFTVGNDSWVNVSGNSYENHLFATCAGVSKVGSYTGNATLTTINCGFTGGARFVLIKRTDTTSDWFVWDTDRGMVAGTDPSISLNTTAAQVNADSVYTTAVGFQLLASPAKDVNTNGGTYIYLAIA